MENGEWRIHLMLTTQKFKMAQSDLGGESKTPYNKLQKITQIPNNLWENE